MTSLFQQQHAIKLEYQEIHCLLPFIPQLQEARSTPESQVVDDIMQDCLHTSAAHL